MLALKRLDYPYKSVDVSFKVDNKDLAILSGLRENCRLSLRELAEKVDMHPNTVFQRITRLEKLGIIRAYRAELDFDKLGYSYCAIVMMKASDGYLNVCRDAIIEKLDIPEIQAFYRVTGDNDWCAVIRAKSQKDFARILEEILSKGTVRTTSYVVLDIEKRPFVFNPFLKIE